ARGRAMQSARADGAMAAFQATQAEIGSSLVDDRVEVAAVNGPTSVVLSGDADELRDFVEVLRGRGHKTRRLRVSHAFHSPLMEPMLDEFRTVVANLAYRRPNIPIVSTVDGSADLSSPDHWVEHVRRTVRFAEGVVKLAEAAELLKEINDDFRALLRE
ncbi:acyltransferase domain-containing protein, partial [Kibdelosporangium lantanae]